MRASTAAGSVDRWFGFVVPAGTPAEIVARLQEEIAGVLQQTAIQDRFKNDGADVVGGTPEEFSAYMTFEAAKWSKVVQAANIKVE